MSGGSGNSFVADEPVLTAGMVSAFIAAVIGLCTAFGVQIDDGQRAAILTVWATGAPIGAAVVVRRRVSPVTPPSPPNG